MIKYNVKKTGFTLIELVIVIVILGILGAVAAPKFLNLQGDAYKANLNTLKSAMNTAATLGHTKAILNGYDNVQYPKASSANNLKRDDDSGDIHFAYGFPRASGHGIIEMMQDAKVFSFGEQGSFLYTHRNANDMTRLTIAPRARHQFGPEPAEHLRCELIYQEPKILGQTPEITLYTQGC